MPTSPGEATNGTSGTINPWVAAAAYHGAGAYPPPWGAHKPLLGADPLSPTHPHHLPTPVSSSASGGSSLLELAGSDRFADADEKP